ncbi:MAG: hypothetical protein ACR2KO_11975 [Geodermatophilaceae bacterium]
MAIVWLLNVILLLVFPVIVLLLSGVLKSAKSIPPTVTAIAGVAQAGSRDLDAVIMLVTTQNYISQVVAGLADYGGSLDAALPDA